MGAGHGGNYMLDHVHRRLLRGGEPVALGDRAFDLLAALAAADGQAVTVAALTASVWPGVTVSAGNLRVQVRALRRVLGDGAVVNVPGVGYRLTLALAPATVSAAHAEVLVGREGDADRLRGLLSRSRLVSVIGPGGVGKTSLAHAVAAGCPDIRVVHVELAPVRQAGLVPAVTAAALSLKLLGGDTLALIRTALSAERTLLVLDNAEHLLDEVAEFADGLLGTCPNLHILLTSREPLGLGGELLLQLCPLSCPPEGEVAPAAIRAYPAVQLVLRNQLRAGGVPPGDAEMPLLAGLCRHLDGLPLGLVLLAALLRDGSVADIARSLEGRFQDLPLPDEAGSRYGNLTRMLDWSVETLSADEQLLLGRLAVFSGTWPVGSAAAVCGFAPLRTEEVPGLVAGLVARSLVVGPGQTQQPCLRLLETIRQYALARHPGLMEREGLRSRLIEGLLVEVRRFLMASGRRSPRENALRFDMADIRAVLDWALGGGDVVKGQELALAAYRLWNNTGPFPEIAAYLTRAWDLCDDTTPPLIRGLLGLLLHGEGLPLRLPFHADRERYGRDELPSALAALRAPGVPPLSILDGLMSAGYIRRYMGDVPGCLALWDEAAGVADAQGLVADQTRILSNTGWLRADTGDIDGARRDFALALMVAEKHGIFRNLILMRLADAEFATGHADRAIDLAYHALSLHEPATPALRQTLHANLSSYLLLQGRVGDAVPEARTALTLTRRMQYSFAHPWTLERGALIALRLGREDLARALAALGDAMVRAASLKRGGPEGAVHERLLAELGPPIAGVNWSAEEALEVLAGLYAARMSP